MFVILNNKLNSSFNIFFIYFFSLYLKDEAGSTNPTEDLEESIMQTIKAVNDVKFQVSQLNFFTKLRDK